MRRFVLPNPTQLFFCALFSACASVACSAGELDFSEDLIARVGPVAPWAKGVADINQDGLDDVLVGGHQPRRFSLGERIANKLGLANLEAQVGELVWYEAPDWRPHVVSTGYAIRTDVEAGDLDADGDIDIIALTDSGVVWFEAPTWQPHLIDARKFHDVELVQLNTSQDSRPDLVLRNQSLFGYRNGDALQVSISSGELEWQSVVLDAPQGEGLAVVRSDPVRIIVNDTLFTAPEQAALLEPDAWRATRYTTAAWSWPHVVVATADFNADGRLDVALAPAEEKGQRYRLSWFEAPVDPSQTWREHVIVADTEAVHHALVAADFDDDGHVDLATARMTQGQDPDEVILLRNLGKGAGFEQQVLSTNGSHNLQVIDADGDFDPDLIGANWQKDNFDGDYPVTLWRNLRPTGTWQRHVMDEQRPGQALNVLPQDLDGDGLTDVTTGAYWYKNPGGLSARWPRHPLGGAARNALLVADFDGNAQPDVLASPWAGYSRPDLLTRLKAKLGLAPDPWRPRSNDVLLVLNPAHETRTVVTVAAALPGDFVHGQVLGSAEDHGVVTLSMHAKNTPLVSLKVPARDVASKWELMPELPHSQNETLSRTDVNQDGREDVITGTRWIDGRDNSVHQIAHTPLLPDRHVLLERSGQMPLRLIVGDEAISRPGRVQLYEMENSAWRAQTLATVVGPMSLDAGDIDGDGDIDVVVGEHNLARPERARLLWLERRHGTWVPHLIGVGDEHHDGAQLADFDRDGDLDVVSIGWSHGRVLLYENPLGAAP